MCQQREQMGSRKRFLNFLGVKQNVFILLIKWGVFTELDIKLNRTSIKVADEAKFLGLVFGRRLTFRVHVKYLKTICDKALNVLRIVVTPTGVPTKWSFCVFIVR